VQKHQGSIRFKSSTVSGRNGTIFSIFLPSTQPAIEGSLRQAV